MTSRTRVTARASHLRAARRRMSVGLAAAAATVAAANGCAQPQAGEQPPVPNWNNPLHGRVEPSLAAAQVHMPCRLRSLPRTAGPARVIDTPGLPPDERIVVLQYRTRGGLVDVYEETPQVSASEFRKVIADWVGLNGQPGSSGTARAFMVQGKYPDLMTTAADRRRSDIRWIQAGVEYTITGPSLTGLACTHLAAALAS